MAKKKDQGVNLQFRDMPDLKTKWPKFLTIGIVLLLLGILAIAFSGFTTVVTVEVLGIFLILGGIFLLANGSQARGWAGVSLSIFLGLLYLVVGGICVFRPLVGAEVITILLAAFFFVGGLFRMVSSLMYRREHWGLVFFNGLVTFILGILIIAEWPIAALWVIGLFVGIDLVLTGISWIYLSLTARR